MRDPPPASARSSRSNLRERNAWCTLSRVRQMPRSSRQGLVEVNGALYGASSSGGALYPKKSAPPVMLMDAAQS